MNDVEKAAYAELLNGRMIKHTFLATRSQRKRELLIEADGDAGLEQLLKNEASIPIHRFFCAAEKCKYYLFCFTFATVMITIPACIPRL